MREEITCRLGASKKCWASRKEEGGVEGWKQQQQQQKMSVAMRMLYSKLKVSIESIYIYPYRKKFELCSIKITFSLSLDSDLILPKESDKNIMWPVCITESLCCIPETNTTL